MPQSLLNQGLRFLLGEKGIGNIKKRIMSQTCEKHGMRACWGSKKFVKGQDIREPPYVTSMIMLVSERKTDKNPWNIHDKI